MAEERFWPRKGDVLFAGTQDWHNACVGWSRNQWWAYAEGYKRGADRLVEHVIEAQTDHDFLVYPIAFLYRQALEIALKRLLLDGAQLIDLRQAVPTHHKLLPLWHECRRIIEQMWPEGSKDDLDAAEEVIGQFDQKDPRATAFRYPVDASGTPSLPKSELINLRNLAEVANRAYALLDACGCGITEYLHMKWEMEREYARE